MERPIVTVGAVILHSETEDILLIKTHKWSDKWAIPGGKIELGETCEEALVREIKEETNLDVYDVSLLTVLDSVNDPEFYKKSHMVLLNYVCLTDGIEVVLNDEAQQYRWVTIDEALEMGLNQATRQLIDIFVNEIMEESSEES